jgi:hypothetical protein
MARKLNYVVYAPGWSPDNGGGMFMHELVNALNRRGERAALWPMAPLYDTGLRSRIRRFLRPPAYLRNPDLDTPVATRADLGPDCVVVYPELVPGNPLKAANVARWLLYTPGVLHPYSFGPDELFFRVDAMFDLPQVTGGAEDLFFYRINPVYRDEGRTDRAGACFMVRKGDDKPRIPQTANALQLDGLSHEEIARVFNRCEVFYSYDEATFYSQYAAICGCLSVVIPGRYASRREWAENYQIARYGIAYGLDDLGHARATRHQLVQLLREREAAGERTVDRFIERTQARFGAA